MRNTKPKSVTKKIISYASLVSCVAFFCLLQSESFASAKSEKLVEQNKEELKLIENYLNNIKNLSAKFIQESGETGLVEGKFFLSRPGKMRIEYLAQPKVLIIVNGSVLSYHDVELDETSRLSTNTTPASFLTRSTISFEAKDVEITNVKKSAEQIKISVMKKNRKEAGEFSLVFSSNPLKFLKMEVKNDLDQIITVTLSDIDLFTPISDKMFVIKNDDLL
jgi:outer membrane lipoprotein-sorting protein